MFTHTLRRLGAATLLGGALVVTPIVSAPAATAATTDCDYSLPGASNTSVTINGDGTFRQGDPFTVTANVTVTGPGGGTVPATGGTVTFTYAGDTQVDNTVVNGEATATFTASTETPVTAEYSGVCVLGSAGVAGSTGSDTPDILGVDDEVGGDNGGNGGNGGSGGISGADSGLGGTGMDTQTELYGLLGLGLVAVGGMTLMVHRRRAQA